MMCELLSNNGIGMALQGENDIKVKKKKHCVLASSLLDGTLQAGSVSADPTSTTQARGH